MQKMLPNHFHYTCSIYEHFNLFSLPVRSAFIVFKHYTKNQLFHFISIINYKKLLNVRYRTPEWQNRTVVHNRNQF